MERPINRISHVIWVVRPENLERYVAEASKLFGVEFERLNDPPVEGSAKDIYISFEAGLEFVAPLAPTDPSAARFLDFLEESGEGIYGFAFGVDRLDEAVVRARELGYPSTGLLQSPNPDARQQFLAKFTRHCFDAQQAYVGTFVNTGIIFGEIDYVDPSLAGQVH